LRVRVYGKGCPRCHALARNVEKALRDLGVEDFRIEHVTDLQEIAKLGPVLTPVLEIDGEIALTGEVLSPAKAREFLKPYLRKSQSG